MAWLERDWPKCEAHWKKRILGVFLDGTTFIRTLWNDFLSEDIHVRSSGRLVINIAVRKGLKVQQRLVSHFPNRCMLVEMLLGATGIPGISLHGFWHNVGGELFCDGAFVDLAPKISPSTVLLSPWRSFQPSGFKHIIAPSKCETARSHVKRKGGALIGASMASSVVARVCFVAPEMSACRHDARRGYEDAKGARELFLN